MKEAVTADLVAVIGITAVFFILGLVAVALFVRQYRREQKDKQSREQ